MSGMTRLASEMTSISENARNRARQPKGWGAASKSKTRPGSPYNNRWLAEWISSIRNVQRSLILIYPYGEVIAPNNRWNTTRKRISNMETEIKNRGAYEAMMRGIAANQKYDLSKWPEDVTDMIRKVCDLWNLKPPETKKSKGYWIQGARELIDAAGEFGVFCLEQVRIDFVKHMEKNISAGIGGIAPYTVEGPGSLVKMTRAKAGELRSRGDDDTRSRHRYIEGEYADFIEH